MKAKQKILLTLAFFGIFIPTLAGVVVYPVFQGVGADHREVFARKLELLQMRENKENSRAFDRVAGQHVREFQQIEDLFVDSKTPIAFFRFLDETAASFGLQLEKAPGPPQQLQGDWWPSFALRLAGQGLYPNFMAFLQKIENAPYLVEVKTLTMSQRRGLPSEESQGEIEFSLSLKVFTK